MTTQAVTGSIDLTKKIKHLRHLDLAENAGTSAPARVLLRDTDQNGAIVAQFNFELNGDRHRTWNPPLPFPGGLYIQVSVGAVRGTVTGE